MSHRNAIRALTFGLNRRFLSENFSPEIYKKAAAEAGSFFGSQGWPLQTVRLLLDPVTADSPHSPESLAAEMELADRAAREIGAVCFNLPLAAELPGKRPELARAALDALKKHSAMFLHQIMDNGERVSPEAVGFGVSAMFEVAGFDPGGGENFRLGVGAGISAQTPFFPFSRHLAKGPGFSFGLEYVNEFLVLADETEGREALLERRPLFLEALTTIAEKVEAFGLELAGRGGLEYFGQDMSLAPFADGRRSVGRLLGRLAGAPYGRPGSVAATRFFSGLIKEARKSFRTCGFNGVMLAPLEDDDLAQGISEGRLDMAKLMLYATVCGCGLDMIGVAGDADPKELERLVADLGALALVHHKPLGARILPLPGIGVGQMSRLNRPDLADTLALALG